MNVELKPCPFCGNDMEMHAVRFKKDNRLVFGVRHEICTIECIGCTASIRQAGTTREAAEEHAINMWNRRQNDEID